MDIKSRVMKVAATMFGVTCLYSMFGASAHAQDVSAETAVIAFTLDNLFIFIAAILVLLMQAGFAMLEVGFNARKNTINILCKNLMDLSVGVLVYFIIGFGLMYPGPEAAGGWLGFRGFFLPQDPATVAPGSLTPQVDWFFQVAFAATAATIVSGAVAGRLKFVAYVIYSALLTGLIYPISGMWKWGGGWLDALGFYDFAGSIIVHALGGFAGLAAAIVLGPRLGRFNEEGEAQPMPGHSMSLTTLGCFFLWVGWYGFNCGSQLAIFGADNVNAVMLVAVNTTLAAAAGSVIALVVSWFSSDKPDITMALNGALAGLVGITANCDSVGHNEAVIIGMVAGVVVYGATQLLEKLQIDDPVGAFPVHGACGIWGGLATGIFGGHPLQAQIIGSIVIPLWGFVTMYSLFSALKAVDILRVSEQEETEGLDLAEHGSEAYQPV